MCAPGRVLSGDATKGRTFVIYKCCHIVEGLRRNPGVNAMNSFSSLAPQTCRASLFVVSTLALSTAMARAEPVTEEQAHAIGVDAYLYFYSPITMDVTRKQLSNVEPGKEFGGPMNTFANVPAYPTAEDRAVVRPNFDTLYSSAWPDLRNRLIEELNLPKDTQRIEAPTPYVWIIGRIKTDGPADYDAVHKIQAGLKVTPLTQWGKT